MGVRERGRGTRRETEEEDEEEDEERDEEGDGGVRSRRETEETKHDDFRCDSRVLVADGLYQMYVCRLIIWNTVCHRQYSSSPIGGNFSMYYDRTTIVLRSYYNTVCAGW